MLQNAKVTKRGVAKWLLDLNQPRYMVDEYYIDMLAWMQKNYPESLSKEEPSMDIGFDVTP